MSNLSLTRHEGEFIDITPPQDLLLACEAYIAYAQGDDAEHGKVVYDRLVAAVARARESRRIAIQVVTIDRNKVRLAISAPKDYLVDRREITESRRLSRLAAELAAAKETTKC